MVGVNVLVAVLGLSQIAMDTYGEAWEKLRAEHPKAGWARMVLAVLVGAPGGGEKKAKGKGKGGKGNKKGTSKVIKVSPAPPSPAGAAPEVLFQFDAVKPGGGRGESKGPH